MKERKNKPSRNSRHEKDSPNAERAIRDALQLARNLQLLHLGVATDLPIPISCLGSLASRSQIYSKYIPSGLSVYTRDGKTCVKLSELIELRERLGAEGDV